jgi:hypothetical protein
VLNAESCAKGDELSVVLRNLRRASERPPRAAVLVTAEAEAGFGGRPSRMAPAALDAWQACLAPHGLELVAVHPQVGCPLLALERVPRDPVLFVQVERRFVAVMELVGRCAELEVFPREEPVLERCRQLVGEGCPEVLLAGGGADLSALGFELARCGTTWVRILKPDVHVDGAAPSGLASIVGAARHAAGLPCFAPVPPIDARLEQRVETREGAARGTAVMPGTS